LFDRHDEVRNDGPGALDAHFAIVIEATRAREPNGAYAASRHS
jgi:hypothetical protein